MYQNHSHRRHNMSLELHAEEPYIIISTKHEEGLVSLKKYTIEDKFIYNRYILRYNLPLKLEEA